MKRTVLDWLEKSVVKYSDKILYSDEDKSITFAEFDKLRKNIGTHLAGVTKPGSPIVVMTGRHIYTPACFLGAVSAGCFYAPLDATMPIARLNQILGVIQSEYMLVDRQSAQLAKQLDFQGTMIVLEDIMGTEPNEALLCEASSKLVGTSPLYVIFTSGSTGTPKGVITSHHSLMCYIDAVCKVLHMDDEDILGNQSPLDYIAAVRDIYIPLKTGASTVIIPKNEFSMPIQLFERLNKYQVTTLCWSVAGIELPAKLGAFDEIQPQHLKKVCFSGSVMPCKYLKIWQEHLPEVLYVNQYGPTEATASCTYYAIEEKVEDSTILPIGKPYENYNVLLLNDDNTATADGEIGEICVTGPILALGYYGDRQRTEEAFVQNPLNSNYRELLYKTGDLGRFREDGILEFHGRKDRQIKHMGHRIELGEIEETAKQLSDITECCALYQKEKELLYLFYIGAASSKEIVLHFRKQLPAFMVPRKLIQLDAMPHLPNGKLDMQTLKTYFK